MRTCPPPSPARSCNIWTCPSVPAIPAPRAVWPTTGPKGHPSGWLVHPLSAHHHLPSPSGTPCMRAFRIQPHFRIWMHPSILASHLGGLFHHKPALVAPLFLWVGYFLCAHHTHSSQPGPPAHPSTHLHTLPHTLRTIVSWGFLTPTPLPVPWRTCIS